MAHEEQQQERDPMALAENHFENQEQSLEQEFIDQFHQPIIPSQGISEQEEDKDRDDNGDGGEEGDTIEDFKFEESIEESDSAELAELNAKLGTNYEDLNTLKKALQQESAPDVSQEIEDDRAHIAYFKTILDPKQYSDKRIVLEDKKMARQQGGQDITNPEILEEIENEVELLESNGVLSYAAQSIKQTVKNALDQKQSKVQKYDTDKQATIQQTEAQRKEGIQEAISTVFKAGDFLGVKPTKQEMIDVYKEVNKNKNIQQLSSNPKDVVEFAMFKMYRERLTKNLSKGSYKDGVKNTLSEIGLSGSEQTVKPGQETQGNNEAEKSYFEKFIQ